MVSPYTDGCKSLSTFTATRLFANRIADAAIHSASLHQQYLGELDFGVRYSPGRCLLVKSVLCSTLPAKRPRVWAHHLWSGDSSYARLAWSWIHHLRADHIQNGSLQSRHRPWQFGLDHRRLIADSLYTENPDFCGLPDWIPPRHWHWLRLST